jgi:hypothetical protein
MVAHCGAVASGLESRFGRFADGDAIRDCQDAEMPTRKIVVYVVQSVFLSWVIWGGGARTLVGRTIHWLAPRWSEEGVKLYAGLLLAASTLWFLVGLAEPNLR